MSKSDRRVQARGRSWPPWLGSWPWPLLAGRCAPKAPKEGRKAGGAECKSDIGAAAAMKVYVAPGDLDEYYMFASGGHSGQMYVYGLPSGRHISTIPVFTPYPATGYGFDDESKKMLGELTWGDAHHPALSEKDGDYDGRWLFVNDMNGRVARIDLRDFKTKQIIGPVPNVSGNHASAFVTPNTEYSMMASRFSIPLPKGTAAMPSDYAGGVQGRRDGRQDRPAERRDVARLADPDAALRLRPGRRRQGGLRRLGLLHLVQHREGDGQARGHLHPEGPRLHRRRGLEAGREGRRRRQGPDARRRQGDRPGEGDPGLVYFLPCGKSPHGVDISPDGKYIIGSGKLQGVTTVFNFEKIQTAIRNKDFTGDEDGIPVLKYESIKDAEVPVGLGPLHTQFGPDGYAYTSLFVDSAIAKWKLGTWEVVDKVPMSYSIGHLTAAQGDTVKPHGKYLVGLNKLSHGRHLNVGPSQPESSQLVDISEEKMKLLLDFFTEPEPHYAQIVKADVLKPIEVYPKEENKHPLAIWDVKDAGVTRNGNKVTVKMVAVRSTLTPTDFEIKEGDEITIAITNIEQTTDELHGLGILDYNINIVVDPGETKTVTFKARKKGVYPYYCTNFCSALHQEMQGYMIVR